MSPEQREQALALAGYFENGAFLATHRLAAALLRSLAQEPAAERLTDEELEAMRDQFLFGEDGPSLADELELFRAIEFACAKKWGVKL